MSKSESMQDHQPAASMLRMLALAVIVGLLVVAIYAVQFIPHGSEVATAAVGLLVSGATLLAGGFLGLLFAVPRALQIDTPVNAADSEPGGQYRANTNLEQISDWLTKILVGVGLTQIGQLPGLMRSVGAYLAPGLGGGETSQAFGVAIVAYFAAAGFLASYLWGRLHLGGAFRQADLAAMAIATRRATEVGTRALQVSQELAASIETQAGKEARALSLSNRQLDPDAQPPSQGELDQAICETTALVRVQIFQVARAQRMTSWRDPTRKLALERTIPIFRALIACDPEREYHRNHAQLGYALKDQREPRWALAEQELTEAIEIRGDWRAKGFVLYEFVRAICRIKLGRPREEILSDLRIAAQGKGVVDIIEREPVTATWLHDQGIPAQHLLSAAERGLEA